MYKTTFTIYGREVIVVHDTPFDQRVLETGCENHFKHCWFFGDSAEVEFYNGEITMIRRIRTRKHRRSK